jgi:large subunit ribosomal protein LP0
MYLINCITDFVDNSVMEYAVSNFVTTWFQGVARLAAVCLSISYPTLASAPHSVINGFKNLLAIAAATDVSFKEAQTFKEFLKVCISLNVFLIRSR